MTVAELIAKLQKAPQDALVLMEQEREPEFSEYLTHVTLLGRPFRPAGEEIVTLWSDERPPTDSGEEIL